MEIFKMKYNIEYSFIILGILLILMAICSIYNDAEKKLDDIIYK